MVADRDAADLALIRAAADAAGRIAMAHFRQPLLVEEKPGGLGPVSAADLAIEAMLRETLLAARPGYGWLSEEAAEDPARATAERVFIVDPIDGTRSFIAGQSGFGVAIAVADPAGLAAGVFHMPAKARTYAARRGGGAQRNGAALRVSTRTALEGAAALTAAAQLEPTLWPGGPPPVDRHYRQALIYRLCLVAEGRFDAVITLRETWEWDAAAGALIAQEAGALVATRGGGPVWNTPGRRLPGVIVAGAGLHGQIMTRLGVAPPAPADPA
jgi:myo-inositol-1(or 4)-monophosphatase